jgi:predicted nucleic acid-binding protein
MILLDTNVLSELMKPDPAERVVRWLTTQPAASLYTTSITQAEIILGVMLLPSGRKRTSVEAAAKAMFEEDFSGRILPFSSNAALLYAQIVVERRRVGRPISHFDAQIAAIARSSGAAIATRNVADFDRCDTNVINPWSA